MAMFINLNARKTKRYKERRPGDDENYRQLYRFSRENVEWMASHFLPENHETRGDALTNVQKMQSFLRYIGDPGFQVSRSAPSRASDVLYHRLLLLLVFVM